MPMYLVTAQVNWETHLEQGRYIVLADSPVQAIQNVITQNQLPSPRTHCEIEEVNSGMMRLNHRAVTAPTSTNVPSVERDRALPTLDFNCKVLGIARGQDEDHALKRLAHTIINRCNQQGDTRDKYVTKLMIDCQPRVLGHEKVRPMEAFELYKGKGIIR